MNLRSHRTWMIALLAAAALASAASADILLPAGTQLQVALKQDVSSGSAKVGDIVPLELTKAVDFGGIIAVPKGAAGTAKVKAVQPAGKRGKPGSIELQLVSLKASDKVKTDQGADIEIQAATPPLVAKGKGKKLVSYLLGFGFLISGGQGVFKAGAPIQATVKKDIVILISE